MVETSPPQLNHTRRKPETSEDRATREGERGRLEVITGEKEGARDKHAAWY